MRATPKPDLPPVGRHSQKGRPVSIQTTAEGGAVTKYAAGATYFGSGTAVIFGMSTNELAAVGGVFVGLAGLAINMFFNWKRDRREQREHEARMKALG